MCDGPRFGEANVGNVPSTVLTPPQGDRPEVPLESDSDADTSIPLHQAVARLQEMIGAEQVPPPIQST